jgi:DNA polymerase III subunit beta
MDVTLPKSALAQLLTLTQSAVSKKTTMPILANVLLSCSGKQLRISASDLEITAQAAAAAMVNSAGSTTVNAKIFGDIVRELPDADVNLKVTENERLEISCKSSRLRVIGVSAEEYPSLPALSLDVRGRVQVAQLTEMISKTLYAVSQDETRFNLNGVCFEVFGDAKSKNLRMVSTDGHRLAVITRPAEGLSFSGRAIVPRRGLAEVKRIIDDGNDRDVGIDVQEGFLLVERGETKLSIRLIDGEFPNYEQVIPKDRGKIAAISSSELAQALRRVVVMVSDKSKCVKTEFQKDQLRISSSSPELGDAVEELPIKYEGKPLSIGFNALYLMDIANSLTENQSLSIELINELSPGRFFAEGDESYFGIVMPMRLK